MVNRRWKPQSAALLPALGLLGALSVMEQEAHATHAQDLRHIPLTSRYDQPEFVLKPRHVLYFYALGF